jgi:hypothetical protein
MLYTNWPSTGSFDGDLGGYDDTSLWGNIPIET